MNSVVDVPRVRETAVEFHQELADAKEVRLEWQPQEELPLLRCDSERVVQVFSNLIDNAIKFTPEGGHVWVDSRPGVGTTFSFTLPVLPEAREQPSLH